MDQSEQAHLWRGTVHTQERFETAQVRVAVLALQQASLATIATVVEDLEAVNLLPDEPGAPLRFAPRVVGRADLAPLTLSGLASPRNAELGDEIYDAVIVPSLFDDGLLSDPSAGPILQQVEVAWLQRQHAGGGPCSRPCAPARFRWARPGYWTVNAVRCIGCTRPRSPVAILMFKFCRAAPSLCPAPGGSS